MANINRVLVTGAAGNVGGAVVNALLVKKVQVVGGTTRPEAVTMPGGVPAVKADYTDPDTVAAALKDVEGLFLVAPPLDLESSAKLNPVIDQAKSGSVSHVVLLSALGVDQSDDAPLRRVEKHLMASGLGYTILRPNFFMENFTIGFLAPMIAQGGIFLAAGAEKTSFIATADIAAVAATAFSEGHRESEYNLTGPTALDHNMVAGIISEVSGKAVSYHALSEEEMLDGVRKEGLPEGAVTYMGVLYQAVRSGWMAGVTEDVQRVTGQPATSFGDFAQAAAGHWR